MRDAFSTVSSGQSYGSNVEEFEGYTYYYGDKLSLDYYFNADIRQVEIKVNDHLKNLNEWKKSYQDQLAALQKQYDGEGPVLDYWGNSLLEIDGNPTIKNAIDYTKDLKAAYESETDATKKDQYKSLYQSALTRELDLKQNIESSTSQIAYYDSQIKGLEKAWTIYQGANEYNEALQAKIKAYNDANVGVYADKVTAWKNYIQAEIAWNEVDSELDAVSTLLYGDLNDGANLIANQIKNLETSITDLQKQNADVSGITSQEEAIAYQKARITAQEAVVKAKQVAVANAKVDLDAAMPEIE